MKLSSTITAIAAGGVLAVTPALALADGNTNSAARSAAEKQCRQERTADTKSTFDQTYATNKSKSNAFGKCVSHRTAQNSTDQSNAQKNAAKTCRSEQADSSFASSHNGETFDQVYGSGKKGKNAFGKCVSTTAKAMTDKTESSQTQAEENAAKQCRAEEHSSGSDAFKAKYGTNKNKSNAFGKCVSAKAKAQEQSGTSGSNSTSG